MVVQGPRTYTLVKVVSDAGLFGIGEAYGNPGAGVKEQIFALKPELIGKDPLQIDVIYTDWGKGPTARHTASCAPSAESRWRSGIYPGASWVFR